MKKFIIKQMLKAEELKDRAIKVMQNKDGLSETTEKLLWVAGSVAIVLIVVGLFVALIKADVMPKLTAKIGEIFNFTANP